MASKFIKGNISFTAFKPSQELSSITKAREYVEAAAFKPLRPEDVEDESVGWVDSELSFDTKDFPNFAFRDTMLVAMRMDRYTFTASQMRPYLEQAEHDFMLANNLEYISAQQKKEIKEQVIRTMKTNSYPKTTIVEMFWSFESNRVYLFSQSGTVISKFIDLFERTFEVSIEPLSIMDAVDQLEHAERMEPLCADIWGL